MVYNNNLIAVVKSKGKVLREFQGNVVRLPFGTDYSIYIKNKDSMRKAVVRVKVDGKDVLDNNSLIVDPGNATELKGFMKDSIVNNKFRFIEKTDEISKHRGNFVEDGLIELEYQFEEFTQWRWAQPITWVYHTTWQQPPVYPGFSSSDIKYGHNFYSNTEDIQATSSLVNDSGITVPGAKTKQVFNTGIVGTLENIKYNIIINLKGEVITDKKTLVKRPITVKTKLRCPTCGRRWSSSLKYCGNCSTYLH